VKILVVVVVREDNHRLEEDLLEQDLYDVILDQLKMLI
jgi:hypothetical protein